MKNLLIGQSGGPTSVINSSLAALIITAKRSLKVNKIYCLKNGIEGLFKNEVYDFTNEKIKEIKKLKNTPGAYIGSCRYKLKEEELETIKDYFIKNKIKYFIYIGGNDSMDTVKKIANYLKTKKIDMRVIGIPKTIDNDLANTDHTPGYLSASKYIITSLKEIKKDMLVYDKKSITIVEVMGRNAGWLTASSILAKPDLIYLPEVEFKLENFIKDIKELLNKKTHILVCVSEGINLDINKDTNLDAFGHKALGGVCRYLKDVIDNELNIKTKAVELNILQRCAAHINCKTDIKEAYNAAKCGLKAAIKGNSGKMVVFKRDNEKIKYELSDIDKIANVEKKIPRNWINKEGNMLNQEFINYIMPILKKEIKENYPNFKKIKLI